MFRIPPDLNESLSLESRLQLRLAPAEHLPEKPVPPPRSTPSLSPPSSSPSAALSLLLSILCVRPRLPLGPGAKALYYIFNAVCNCSAHSTCREQMMLQRLACWDLDGPGATVALNRFLSSVLTRRSKMKDLLMSDVCFYQFAG